MRGQLEQLHLHGHTTDGREICCADGGARWFIAQHDGTHRQVPLEQVITAYDERAIWDGWPCALHHIKLRAARWKETP